MQTRLIKVLYEYPFRTPSDQFHVQLDSLKVKDIYQMNILNFVYKSVKKLSIEQFHKYYKKQTAHHDHDTRQHCNLYVEQTRTAYGHKMTKKEGALLWNSISLDIQNSSSISVFKKAIRQLFISKYTAIES